MRKILILSVILGTVTFYFVYLRCIADDSMVSSRYMDQAVGDEVRLFVVGDTGSGNSDQERVAEAMEKKCLEGKLDGVLMLGDHAYPNGFSSVDDPKFEALIERPYGKPCLSQVPFYPVLGNHDYRINPGAQILYSEKNAHWKMPGRFYQVQFSKLLKVLALDSNLEDVCLNPDKCALDFMRQGLSSLDTTWTFVVAHHPIASASPKGFSYRGGVRGMLLKPWLCHKADLYLAGHSHHLEHRIFPGCRLETFVSGGGGATLYEPDFSYGKPDFARSSFGFLELKVTNDKLRSTFWSDQGEKLYQTEKAAVTQ